MMTLSEARTYVGKQIKSDHPYAYKSGQWGTIASAGVTVDRIVWAIIWPDSTTDAWPVEDPTADYQFRNSRESDQLGRALDALKAITLAIRTDIDTPGIRAPRELRSQLIGILANWGEAEEASR